jgi:hypothetical protein
VLIAILEADMEKAEKWVMCEGEYFYCMDQFDQDQKYIPSSMFRTKSNSLEDSDDDDSSYD